MAGETIMLPMATNTETVAIIITTDRDIITETMVNTMGIMEITMATKCPSGVKPRHLLPWQQVSLPPAATFLLRRKELQ